MKWILVAFCLLTGCRTRLIMPRQELPDMALVSSCPWDQAFIAPQKAMVDQIAFTADGGLIVAGLFDGESLTVGARTLKGNPNDTTLFLVRLGSDGTVSWDRTFRARRNTEIHALAIGPDGNIVIAGELHGEADFGGGAIVNMGTKDGFVVSFSPGGALRWATATHSQDASILAVSVAADGTVFVAGGIANHSAIDLGGGSLAPIAALDGFLAAWTADGAHLWSKRFGAPSGEVIVFGVAADGEGGVGISGSFRGNVDFGAGPLQNPADKPADVFLARFASDGVPLWSKSFGAPYSTDQGVGLAADSSQIAVTGNFGDSIDFGDGPRSGDLFVASFELNGRLRWVRTADGLGYPCRAAAVALGGEDVVVAGYFDDEIDFGSEVLKAGPTENLFEARYSADGQLRSVDSLASSRPITSALGPQGQWVTGGLFSSTVTLGNQQVTSSAGGSGFTRCAP